MRKTTRRYDKYKDSNIEWVGEIPEHWKLKRHKDNFQLVTKRCENRSFIKVGLENIESQTGRFIETESEFDGDGIEFKPNDILFGKLRPYLAKVYLSEFRGSAVGDVFVYCPRSNINPNFSRYTMLSHRYIDVINSSTVGAKMPRVSSNFISNLPFATPPPSEQKAIASYLDTKTAQIDRKIDLLTQKAKRYEELKRSLINETVIGRRKIDNGELIIDNGGRIDNGELIIDNEGSEIDNGKLIMENDGGKNCQLSTVNYPLYKDSAIEWIDKIPEHWEVERINDVAVQQKIKNVGLKEKNLLSLSYGKIKRRDFDTSFGLLPESFETYQIIEAGNIILRLTDLQNDQRSLRVGLVPEKGIITSAYLCLKFAKRIYPNFAYYLLHSYDLSKVFYWFGGGLRQSMKFDDIKVFPFVIPRLSEQQAIAHYLDTKTAQIDQIIQTINTQIEKLQELRKTLINDVVTGKIKVMDNG